MDQLEVGQVVEVRALKQPYRRRTCAGSQPAPRDPTSPKSWRTFVGTVTALTPTYAYVRYTKIQYLGFSTATAKVLRSDVKPAVDELKKKLIAVETQCGELVHALRDSYIAKSSE